MSSKIFDINGCYPFAEQGDENDNIRDKPDKPEKAMYRSMPAAFFGPDISDNDYFGNKPDDTPKYRSLGAMQPAFANEFS